tara:strand:+ start:622 stop:1299 length:678 start_codon:yes stop_codon:yes gene_type:complete
MKSVKVSVIISAFNEEKYIGRCLRSLINQSMNHDEYEIIVINDGSTDKTAYALDNFKSPKEDLIKINLITNKTNLGLPSSLNKGIVSAKGKYIVRVDADDFVNFNFLKFLSFYLDTNPDSNAVSCDYYLINDKEEVIKRVDSDEIPIACGIIFRKETLMNIGLYDESFFVQEEVELRLRYLKNYSIDRLQIPLYRYRRHENNITNDEARMNLYANKIRKKHNIDL